MHSTSSDSSHILRDSRSDLASQMIARNFIQFPEALRFQREMFSNGYHNSPRIMRLMECVFDWTPTAPDWWKEAKGRARDLARRVKKSINDFFKDMAVKASDQLSLVLEALQPTPTIDKLQGMTEIILNELLNSGIHDLEELADLAPDEVMEITGLAEEHACNLLRQARAHWLQS